MTAKHILLEKFELFLSNLVFLSESNILNLEKEPLLHLKEMCEHTEALIERTEESDDYNQLWSLDHEACYDNLLEEYFKMIKTLAFSK
jgi:hypothetical protein